MTPKAGAIRYKSSSHPFSLGEGEIASGLHPWQRQMGYVNANRRRGNPGGRVFLRLWGLL
jgi:hypothetical protein